MISRNSLNKEPKVHLYFRDSLSGVEKANYDALLNGLMKYKDSIPFYGVSSKQIEAIFQKLKQDVPLLFFVEKIVYQYMPVIKSGTVIPEYRFSKEQVDKTIVILQDKINSVVQLCIGKNDKEKEKIIHDFLCNNVKYDNSFRKSSFECVGPLLFGSGVCEGISKAAKFLFDAVGIESLIIHGESKNQLNNSSIDLSHAWNIVKINQCYFHLDITFDLTIMIFGVIRYDYFNLADKDIKIDHFFDNTGLPVCLCRSNYFVENNMYMETQQMFKDYLERCLRQEKRDIVVKLPYISDVNRAKKKVMDIVQKCMIQKENGMRQYQVSCNESQRVFHLHII